MMNPLLQNEFIERLGWVLLHSLWQIALLALLYSGFKSMIRSAQHRYIAGVVVLMLAVTAPIVTLTLLPAPTSSRVVESQIPNTEKHSQPTTAQQSNELQPLPNSNDRTNPATPQPSRTDTAPSVTASDSAEPESDAIAFGPATPIAHETTTISDTLVAWRNSISNVMRPWTPYAVLIWIIGVFILSLRPILGAHVAGRLARQGKSKVSAKISQTVARLCRQMGLKKTVEVFTSKLVNIPIVVGYFQPIILLPASALTNLSAVELESILRHELAHIRRHDAFVNFVQTLVETLLFYHPCLWWISKQIRIERENCCDDLAIQQPADAIHLAQALLRLEEMRLAPNVLAASGGDLKSRIARLLAIGKIQKPSKNRTAVVAAISTASIAMLITVTTLVSAGESIAETTDAPATVENENTTTTTPASTTTIASPIVISTSDQLKMVNFKTSQDLKSIPKTALRLRYIGDRYSFDRKLMEQIASRFPKLIELDLLEVRSLRDADVAPLSKLTELRSLRIRFAERLSRNSIDVLKPLKKLKILDLSYTRGWSNDDALAKLPRLPALRRLILTRHGGGGCTIKSLPVFQNLPALKSLFLTDQHPLAEAKIGGQKFRLHIVSDVPHLDLYTHNNVISSLENFAGVSLHATMLRNWTENSFEFPSIDLTLQIHDRDKFADSEFASKKIQVTKSNFELVIDGKVYRHHMEYTRRKTVLDQPRRFQLDLNESHWTTDTGIEISGMRARKYLELKPGKHLIQVRYKGFGNMVLKTQPMIFHVARSPNGRSQDASKYAANELGTNGHSRQVAARPIRQKWTVAETPTIDVRLKNRAIYNIPEKIRNKQPLTASTSPNGFAIEINGKRYDYKKTTADWIQRIQPGEWLDCQLQLNHHWICDGKRLRFKPGKYTIRVLSLHIRGRAPATSKEFELIINGADETEKQRRENELAYKRGKAELQKNHAGKWMAIANGKIHGPFESLKSADETLRKKFPNAKHRFIFRPTVDDKNVSFAISPFNSNNPAWRQIGTAFAKKYRFVDDVAGNKMHATPIENLGAEQVRRINAIRSQLDKISIESANIITQLGPKHPKVVSLDNQTKFWKKQLETEFRKSRQSVATINGRMPTKLTSFDSKKSMPADIGWSRMLADQLTLTEFDVKKLGLDLFSVPGTATYVGDKKNPGRKVYCRIKIEKLGIDEVVLAYVLSEKTTGPEDKAILLKQPLGWNPSLPSTFLPRQRPKYQIFGPKLRQPFDTKEILLPPRKIERIPWSDLFKSQDTVNELKQKIKQLGSYRNDVNKNRFQSGHYAEFANQLLTLKIEQRVKLLKDWCKEYPEQIIVLCRMLFQAKSGGEFRRPQVGKPLFVKGTAKQWPLEPIAVVEEIPFLVVRGYAIAGEPEPSIDYLEYCLKNCDWTSKTYANHKPKHLDAAITKLMLQLSDRLDSGLLPFDPAFLREQVMTDAEFKKAQQKKWIDQLESQIKKAGSYQNINHATKNNFRSYDYMWIANRLQLIDEKVRIKLLKKWCKPHNDQVIVLCRMLFTAKKGSKFRRPALGGPTFIAEGFKSGADPVRLQGSVPFVVVHGYILSGQAEPAAGYLDYCLTKCDWSTNKYQKFDRKSLQTALDELLTQHKITDASTKEFFNNQIKRR